MSDIHQEAQVPGVRTYVSPLAVDHGDGEITINQPTRARLRFSMGGDHPSRHTAGSQAEAAAGPTPPSQVPFEDGEMGNVSLADLPTAASTARRAASKMAGSHSTQRSVQDAIGMVSSLLNASDHAKTLYEKTKKTVVSLEDCVQHYSKTRPGWVESLLSCGTIRTSLARKQFSDCLLDMVQVHKVDTVFAQGAMIICLAQRPHEKCKDLLLCSTCLHLHAVSCTQTFK